MSKFPKELGIPAKRGCRGFSNMLFFVYHSLSYSTDAVDPVVDIDDSESDVVKFLAPY